MVPWNPFMQVIFQMEATSTDSHVMGANGKPNRKKNKSSWDVWGMVVQEPEAWAWQLSVSREGMKYIREKKNPSNQKYWLKGLLSW